MQGCEEFSVLLSASLDGELTPDENERLGAHMRTCKDCQAYLALMQATGDQLRAAQVKPPEKLIKGIQYKVELEASHKRFRFGAYGRWTVIAAVICLAVLGIVKLSPLGGARAKLDETLMTASGVPHAYAAEAANNAAGDELEMKFNAAAGAASEGGEESSFDTADNSLMLTAPAPTVAEEPDLAVSMDKAALQPDSMQEAAAITSEDAEDMQSVSPQYRVEELPGFAIYQSLPKSASYYSVCILYDALPEAVTAENGCTQLDAPEGQQRWAVPLETILELELAEDFDEIYYRDLMADQGLVIVLTEEE